MLDAVFFYAFASIAVVGGLGTVTLRNPVHCAAALIGSLMGVAGIFLLQGAEFLSVAQVIVYVGGVMLLFLFVLMLVNVRDAKIERRFSSTALPALGFTAALGGLLLYFLTAKPLELASAVSVAAPEGNTEQLGTALFTTDLLPFEIASVLLLAALLGSVVLARKRA